MRRLLVLVLLAGSIAPGAPASAAAPAAGAAPDTTRRAPALLVPARPDSAPPESAPAPLLIPGRPAPPDSSTLTRAQRARESYRLGRQLEAAGSHGPAIISYRNAVRFDPTIPDANYRMAMLFLTRDQVGEAIKCLLGELSRHPENVDASRHLGLCFARMGDSTRAIDHLDRLSRAHPADGAVWHALGSVYLMSNRPRQAEAALRKALRLEPTTAEELRDMGAVMAALGRTSEARIHYRRALQISPADAPTWFNLGNLERRASRPDSALALYHHAEASDSAFVPGLEAQIQVLRERRRDREAIEVYRRWLRQHPDHHGARIEAVRMLDEGGREDEALALAREGTEQVKNSGHPWLILGMVLRGRGDTRGAVAALRQAEVLFKDDARERDRATSTIAALRGSASDSLRALFAADSVEAQKRRR